MTSQMQRYTGQGPEGSRVQEFVFCWSWGARHINIYSHGSVITPCGVRQEKSRKDFRKQGEEKESDSWHVR